MANEMTITILDSGTAKIETGTFQGSVHVAAEAAIAWIAREMGGPVTRTRRVSTHQHTHLDGTTHEHA